MAKSLIVFAVFGVTVGANAAAPSCIEQYESFVYFNSAKEVCEFDEQTLQIIRRYGENTKRQCNKVLTEAVRSPIDGKVLLTLRNQIKEHGSRRVCNMLEKSADGLN